MNRCIPVFVWLAIAAVSSAADEAKPPTVKEPELRSELLKRVKVDQDVRGDFVKWMTKHGMSNDASFEASLNPAQKAEFQKLAEAMGRIDVENTKRLGEIVDQYGWPTISLVGQDGAGAAWLLVQHADKSPKFQRKCLDLMRALPREEVSQKDFAYLTDRVLLAEGKKQVYGTQFTLVNGKCKPRPLEDEANVDRRRKDVGLPPLAEYFKQAESFYVGGPKK